MIDMFQQVGVRNSDGRGPCPPSKLTTQPASVLDAGKRHEFPWGFPGGPEVKTAFPKRGMKL